MSRKKHITRLLLLSALFVGVLFYILPCFSFAIITGVPQWITNGVTIETELAYWPKVASDGYGGAVIAWDEFNYSYSDWDIVAKRVDSAGNTSWGMPGWGLQVIGDNHGGTPQGVSKIIEAGTGKTIITGINGGVAYEDIIAKKLNVFGTAEWTGSMDSPYYPIGDYQMATDGSGGVIAGWALSNAFSGKDEVYVQRLLGANGTRAWIQPVKVCDQGTNWWYHPQVASDGSGGAIAIWTDNRRTGDNYKTDLYAQRVSAGGATQWTINGVTICAYSDWDNYYHKFQQIVSDGSNGAVITWMDYREGSNYPVIYAQRVDSGGNVLWGTNGKKMTTTFAGWSVQKNPEIIISEPGYAIITWDESFSGAIYAQKVDLSNGSLLWGGNGLIVGTSEGILSCIFPKIVSDRANGAIISWWDRSSYALFAQRLDSSGNKLWAPGGVKIYTGAAINPDSGFTSIASTGIAEMVIAWEEERTQYQNPNFRDIYAQKIKESILDVTPPVVTVLSPNGGELMKGGSKYNITWTATDDLTPSQNLSVEVYYTLKKDWILIGVTNESSTGIGTFEWTLPLVTTTEAKIKVVVKDQGGNIASDESNAKFKIDSTSPIVTVFTPNGGETLKGGNKYKITWKATDETALSQNLSIEVYYTLKTAWVLIGVTNESSAGIGTFEWTVPLVNTTEAKVRVLVKDQVGNIGSDTSDAKFNIDSSAPFVTVISPNGGEILKGGSKYNITWRATDETTLSQNLSIEVYYTSGESWILIAATKEASTGFGTFEWSVPLVTTTEARIRVIAKDEQDNIGTDECDAKFKIDSLPPAVNVTAPTGTGVILGAKTKYTIGWSATDLIGLPAINYISIYLTTNEGSSWTILTIQENNDPGKTTGTFEWTVPIVTSKFCRISVEARDAAGNTAYGLSSNDFEIYRPLYPVVYVSTIGTDTATGTSPAYAVMTVQEGLDSVAAGGLVIVDIGTYMEHNIIWPNRNNITLRGNDTPSTIIHGAIIGRVISIEGNVNLSIEALTIKGGQAPNGGNGGGIYHPSSGFLNLTNCKLESNRAGSGGGDGGGVYTGGEALFTNCSFLNNSAGYGAFSGSISAGGDGGGAYITGNASFNNCTFSSNNAGGSTITTGTGQAIGGNGGGAYVLGNAFFTGCTFSNCHGGSGNCVSGKSFGGSGGCAYVLGNASLINCKLNGNTAGLGGGAASERYGGNGGGIYSSGSVSATNCIFNMNNSGTGTTAGNGGAIYANSGNIINCTLYLNNAATGSTANGRGGGVYFAGGTSSVVDSIFWKNVAAMESMGTQIYNNGGTVAVSYSDIQYGPAGIAGTGINYGTGNISSNPLFNRAAYGDFHLLSTSECIDSGTFTAGVLSFDIELSGRPKGYAVDMGAYEYFEIVPPRIILSSIKVDGADISSVGYVSKRPVIEADIEDIYIDTRMTNVEVQIGKYKYIVTPTTIDNVKKIIHIICTPEADIESGGISILATNLYGQSDEFMKGQLKIAGHLGVSGRPKNVPNPFRPRHRETTTIIYTLTDDADISLIIYDITGRPIWQRRFLAKTMGGSVNENRVEWNGKSDFGEYAPNGAYIYLITSGDKILAKGQMALMD